MSVSPILSRTILFASSLMLASCELIGDIFQAGLVVGIIVVVLIVALLGWLFRKFRS